MQGSAITMIYPDKVTSSSMFQQPFHILELPPACSATLRQPTPTLWGSCGNHACVNWYNKSQYINISTLDFCIWQHFDSKWTIAHMQKLADVPKVPITQLYKHMLSQSETILPFEINRDMEGPPLTWEHITQPGTCIGTIGMILATRVGICCLKRSCFRPATLRHWPYSPVSSWNTIVDDDVEAAPIYRGRAMVEKPVRSHNNHD